MINLTIIEKSEPQSEWYEQMKAYAAVADGAQDSLLRSLFARAILRVQEMSDKSLIACRIRLEVTETDGGIRLYQTPKELLSVTDGKGNALEFSQDGRMVYTLAQSAVVEYTTEPQAGDIEDLLPVVYEYTTALYDGQDNRTLANILRQCR